MSERFPHKEPYRAVTLANFEELPQVRALPEEMRRAIRVVGSVLPFKTNAYVVERLIDWSRVPDDPLFVLTFPQKGMLKPQDYRAMERLIDSGADAAKIRHEADRIRLTLNPHPAGQLQHNLPIHRQEPLEGMQHKYRETILFFPSQGQTCHAYCTFCFRWAQFVGMEDLKFATREAEVLCEYLREHPYTTDVLFTGGDPLIMKTKFLAAYVDQLLAVPSLRTIRIGTKALAYWPQRVVSDDDAEELLALFRKVTDSGRHLAIMSHFNHFVELSTPEVAEAASRIRAAGAQIRTQSPVMRHINDDADVWARMWQKQVEMGMIPYYMFVARDTGARQYFEVPLERAWQIFRSAYNKVSGLGRTVRGPSMSATPGKVQVLGVTKIRGEKVFVLRFLQGRNPEWVHQPFFAKYDPKAAWLDDLKPALGEKKFFFQEELDGMLRKDAGWPPVSSGKGAARSAA